MLAILALALLIRVIAVVATLDYEPVTDPADYQRHAISIAAGDGYPESEVASGDGPTAFRPPLYPYFLGGLYAAIGEPSVDAARLVQALIGVATVALIGLLARQLFDRTIALVAMALAAVYPPLWISDTTLVSESLFLPLELGALSAVLAARASPHTYRWLALAGALTGLATLARPNGFVLLLPLAVAAWGIAPREIRGRGLRVAALALAAAVVVLPWTIRNAVELDSFVPVTTQAGYTLAGTYNSASEGDEEFPGAWRPPPLVPEYADLFSPTADLSEVETEKELRDRALDYVGAHPAYVLEAGLWNTLRMLDLTGWSWSEVAARDLGVRPSLADLSVISFWLAAVLAVLGAFTPAARSIPGFVWVAIVVLALSVVLISGTTRYRTPLEPFVVLLASLALVDLWGRLKASRARPEPG